MYLAEKTVNFKKEKREQKYNIVKNRKLIQEMNILIDNILSTSLESGVNQTFFKPYNDSFLYIRKVDAIGTTYYSFEKSNQKNVKDYEFEYFYGDAMINTDNGIKKMKKMTISQETLNILIFDLKNIFHNDKKILAMINKLEKDNI